MIFSKPTGFLLVNEVICKIARLLFNQLDGCDGAIAPRSSEEISQQERSVIYYMFSSTLLASCGEAMTEYCGLLSSSTALGQLRRFVAVLLC